MASMPASPDAIADLPVRDTIASRNHMSDDLVAGYNGAVITRLSAMRSQYIGSMNKTKLGMDININFPPMPWACAMWSEKQTPHASTLTSTSPVLGVIIGTSSMTSEAPASLKAALLY